MRSLWSFHMYKCCVNGDKMKSVETTSVSLSILYQGQIIICQKAKEGMKLPPGSPEDYEMDCDRYISASRKFSPATMESVQHCLAHHRGAGARYDNTGSTCMPCWASAVNQMSFGPTPPGPNMRTPPSAPMVWWCCPWTQAHVRCFVLVPVP